MRQRNDARGTIPATPNNRIAEIGQGTTSEVRNLMLEYMPLDMEEEDAGRSFPMASKGGPQLEVGEM